MNCRLRVFQVLSSGRPFFGPCSNGVHMQFLSPLILFTSCTLLATTLLADEQAPAPSECQIKSQEISSKIQDAKTEGNKAEQAGLEKALAEVNANCTETSLIKQ
ncbi:Protein yqjC, partial [Pseudomonas savastanoi pv. glycinea]